MVEYSGDVMEIKAIALLIVASVLLGLWLEKRHRWSWRWLRRNRNPYELRDLQEERLKREADADYIESMRGERDETN